MSFNASAAFEYLDRADTALSGLRGWLDNTFESINIYGQEGVDAICSWSGEWVSYKIAQIECMVVKGLHGAYKGAMDHMAIGGVLYSLASGGVGANLGELASAVMKLLFPWVPPALAAIQTMTQVPVKLISIASKIADLTSYRPPINTPGITTGNFHIHAQSISMGDVISGTFPEPTPPQPFTYYMKQQVALTKQKIADTKAEAQQSANS